MLQRYSSRNDICKIHNGKLFQFENELMQIRVCAFVFLKLSIFYEYKEKFRWFN